ncbi:PIN domain-containing protein [Paraburkholderia sp. RL17-373-BIF-A]|uniref:PIN domain-containing protein n=1 Tax=Paraburkholderia sp. RL17-373-BIF-A TaxID=3031629 RepID=UPI0038BD3214
MPANLISAAEVVDISNDVPTAEDVFFVDTNVWYWMTYTKASTSGARAYQINSYPAYTNNALNARSTIYQSGLSLAELSHLIEKAERDIFAVSNPSVTPKEFRHNFPIERANVCSEVEAACIQVTALADPLEITIDETLSNSILDRFSKNAVDGYDLFILESMKAHGIVQVITDDGDFATVPDIRLFTANQNVIATAKAQGKLLTR